MKLTKIALVCALAAGTVAPQTVLADDSFEFHGYARAGVTYEQNGKSTFGPLGYENSSIIGRLGNEGNGLEILMLKKFEGDNDTKWDVGFMVDDWRSGAGLGVKQIWAGGSNIFPSQPNAYIWAGKVFHGRMQQGLNDYYLAINDGEGTGVKGLDLNFADLELGFVTSGDDSGQYSVTSKLSNIALGPINLDIIANYGFTDDTVELDDAMQLVTKFNYGSHNFYYRYADSVGNSLSWSREDDLSSHYISFDGSFSLSEKIGLEYLASYTMVDKASDDEDYDGMTAIIRPTYQWNNIHSTWLEFGYGQADFENGSTNSAYKATISQNIAVGGVTWARPQIRFYVTAGNEDNEQTRSADGAWQNVSTEDDAVVVGAMFEAWW